MPASLAYLVAVIFVATLIRSSLGFGEALVAVPLLALRMPIRTAAPLAVLVSITIAALIVAQDWRDIHARSAGWLVAATLPGIPLGLWLLTAVDGRVVKAVLALVIGAFAAYSLARRAPPRPERARLPWLLGCGLCAGVLGGAYGMNGPPLAVYGSLQAWSPARFRATLQAYFLPASLIGMAGYWVAGLWSRAVTHDFLLALPAVLTGVVAGRMVHRRLKGRSFARLVYGGLILTSVGLLAQALLGAPRGEPSRPDGAAAVQAVEHANASDGVTYITRREPSIFEPAWHDQSAAAFCSTALAEPGSLQAA